MGLIGLLVMALSGKSHEQQHHGYNNQPVQYVPVHMAPANNYYTRPQRSSCYQRKAERRAERECRRAERTMLRAEHRCERAVRRAERRGGCCSRRRQPVAMVPVPMGQRGGYDPEENRRMEQQMYAPPAAMETRAVENVKAPLRSVSTETLREDSPPSYEESEKKN